MDAQITARFEMPNVSLKDEGHPFLVSNVEDCEMPMLIEGMTVGPLDTNCYLITCEETCVAAVVDPGSREWEARRILKGITEENLQLRYIINTHGHADHISGNSILKQRTAAEILVHENDASKLVNPERNLSQMLGVAVVSPPADRLLHDRDTIRVGNSELKVIHTPGHTRGSISLYCEGEDAVFTGDTLFAGSIGRTDLPGSSLGDIMRSLRDKLMRLPDRTMAYPGHGDKTTIGKERLENPFLLT